jgi:integrase
METKLLFPRALEQGQASWAKDTVQAQRDLGDPYPFADGEPMPGIGTLQLGNRQQASSLRPHTASSSRRLPWSNHGVSGLVLQRKTHRPVQFEITEPTREAVSAWITSSQLKSEDFLFPSRIRSSPHLSTRQYARIVDSWVEQLGLNATSYGTHTLRRTKATLTYRRTKNLRAVQLLLGHSKLESTVRYLGIEVDDALEMAEQTEV